MIGERLLQSSQREHRQGRAPEGLSSEARNGWSSKGQGSEGGRGQETQGWATSSSAGQCTIFLAVIPGHRLIHSFIHSCVLQKPGPCPQ